MAATIVSANSPNSPPLRAAQYVRMSTDHQQYSTQNQADKIREYAARRGIEIVQTYADEGKSGLRLDGRDALQRLIADVKVFARQLLGAEAEAFVAAQASFTDRRLSAAAVEEAAELVRSAARRAGAATRPPD